MKRTSLTVLLVLTALLGATAIATAGISVYKSSFSSRGQVKELEKLSGKGKKCKRDWRDKSTYGVTVKGKVDCAVSTPVEGDGKRPDHIVSVVGKVTKATDKKVRETTYVGVTVRANRKEGYELRVFPKRRRWQLLKSGEVLQQNRNKVIEGLAKKNRLQISVEGDTVSAKVNRRKLASVRDRNAEQVGGRKTGLTFGNRKSAKKAKGKAFFDKLKVQVPVP